MNSNVQITALKKEFQDGQTGFEVKVEGMEGKLDLAMNFRDPLKAMKYSFLLAKRLDLQIDRVQLAAMSLAYQRAKDAMAKAVEDAANAANELAGENTEDVEDSAPAKAEEPAEPVITESSMESSPMLVQFEELKKKHPEALLLFRCGDFYETYHQDAVDCARILGITLTRRNSDNVQMAGFPYHALDTYLPKIIRSGRRVAICDKLETAQPQPKKRGRKPKAQDPEQTLNLEEGAA